MARKDHWLPTLVEVFNHGCSKSQFIINLQEEEETLQTGRELCLTLWPFINGLPHNIKTVRANLPESMESAHKFFGHLSDEEGYYQGLYKKQCYLAGIDDSILADVTPGPATKQLCELIENYCSSQDVREGILAVVTAELAATVFARHSLVFFENYFENNPPQTNNISLNVSTDEGLSWLRLHAKPQTRHALWMKRAVDSLDIHPPNKLPRQVETLVKAIFAFWRSTEEYKALKATVSQ